MTSSLMEVNASRRFTTRARVRQLRELNGALVVGLTIFAGALLLALVGAVALGDPNKQDLNKVLAKPMTSGHPLGTDQLGRDVLSWIAHSITTSLRIGLAVAVLSAVVGVSVGVVAAYAGGLLDSLLMRVVDLQLSIPPLLMFIAVTATVGASVAALILLLSAITWVPYARLVRTQIVVEKQRASIAAARLAGVGHARIIVRHLLPSVGSVVLVLSSLTLGAIILAEAILAFVGLGVQPPETSLGYLIAQGRGTLAQAWWVVVFPGAMLVLLIVAANLVGQGLRDQLGVKVEATER